MQQILRALSYGYVDYTSGFVHAEKGERLYEKFKTEYFCEASAQVRKTRKAKGLSNTFLYMYPAYGELGFNFVLLVSPGDRKFLSREKLRSSTSKRSRLVYEDRFVALRKPRKGGSVSWTWQFTNDAYDNYVAQIKTVIRNRRDGREIIGVIKGLNRVPRFRGINTQRGGLYNLIHNEWRRCRGGDACPHISKNAGGYLRAVSAPVLPIGLVASRLLDGNRAFEEDEVMIGGSVNRKKVVNG